ncbi:methyltransferase domain-containing protein [Nocardiopsis alba]|uniref:methyltransferase domain-containing protein n=1 Tax=Nocardiopsis alba TaxID=53437 RepID=UPI0033BB063F
MDQVHGLQWERPGLMGQDGPLDHTALARTLAERLPAPGHIRDLFATVPRHRFLPDVVWGENRVRHDRTTDPDGWLHTAYTDQALITQRDDGVEGGMGLPTSSSSAPTVMARMLTAARIEPDHRVLEIGTGTGYNAALLSGLLGARSVTTIEIDEAVAAAARSALHAHGVSPTVITGDGELSGEGFPLYDQVIATCTVSEVPAAWVHQVREGGRIVTPWSPTPGAPGGVLAVLEVTSTRAEGRFEGSLAFMWARGQRRPGRGVPVDAVADQVDRVDGDPRESWLDGELSLLLALLMPHWCHGMGMEDGAEDPYVWIASTTCSSWARLHADGRVEQGGSRRLVDQASRAWEAWETWNRPEVSDFGLTVDLERGLQTVWIQGSQHVLWSARR